MSELYETSFFGGVGSLLPLYIYMFKSNDVNNIKLLNACYISLYNKATNTSVM